MRSHNWHREGDINLSLNSSDGDIKRWVRYWHNSSKGVLENVDIYFSINHHSEWACLDWPSTVRINYLCKFKFSYRPTKLFQDALNKARQECFGSLWNSNVASEDDLNRIVKFLKKINSDIKGNEIPDMLINEIENLYKFYCNCRIETKFIHSIKTKSGYSDGVAELFVGDNSENLSIEEVRQIKLGLSRNQDPNQVNKDGNSLLYIVVQRGTIKLLKLLLFGYHADMYLKYDQNHSCVVDYIYQVAMDQYRQIKLMEDSGLSFTHQEIEEHFHYYSSYNCMMSIFSQPIRSPQIKVEKMSMSHKDNQIQIKFKFDNKKKLVSIFKANEEMTPDEEKFVTESTVKEFCKEDDKDDIKITIAAVSEIKAKHSHVSFIRHNDRPVGYVFKRLRILDEVEACQLYCSLAYMDDEFRDYKIMPLLIYFLGFSAQLMRPSYNVSVLGVYVSHLSYRLVKDFVGYPKYQPDYLTDAVVTKMLDYHTGPDTNRMKRSEENPLVSYVENQMMLRRPVKSNDCNADLFYEEILDCDNLVNSKGRGAISIFWIDREKFMFMSACCLKLGINFYDFIFTFAKYLSEIRHEPIPEPLFPFRKGSFFLQPKPAALFKALSENKDDSKVERDKNTILCKL